MSKDLQIFEHNVFGSIRVVERNNEPWFVANDVCRCLDHGNPRQVISRLKDTQKGVRTVDTLGGNQETAIISESGLYALIFTSRKKEAIAFQDWVCEEVLPSIRRHGAYIHDESAIIKMLGSIAKILERLESRVRTLEAGRSLLIENPLADSELMSYSDMCRYIVKNCNRFTLWESLRILCNNGVLVRSSHDKHWASDQSIKAGLFFVRKELRVYPSARQHVKRLFVTRKGLEEVNRILGGQIASIDTEE